MTHTLFLNPELTNFFLHIFPQPLVKFDKQSTGSYGRRNLTPCSTAALVSTLCVNVNACVDLRSCMLW